MLRALETEVQYSLYGQQLHSGPTNSYLTPERQLYYKMGYIQMVGGLFQGCNVLLTEFLFRITYQGLLHASSYTFKKVQYTPFIKPVANKKKA